MLQVNPGEDDTLGCIAGFIVVVILIGSFALAVDKIIIPIVNSVF